MSAGFDLEAVYDQEISPLMTRLIEICKVNNIPMLASFLYARAEDGEDFFCTTALVPRPPDPRHSRTLSLATTVIQEGVREDQELRLTSGDLAAITVEMEGK